MTKFKTSIMSLLLVLLGSVSTSVLAENSKTFGDYIVHYNAFRSDTLTPEIAKAYSPYSTQQPNGCEHYNTEENGDVTKPVKGSVTGFASNLNGQIKELEFKEILDGEAIYYPAQSQVSHMETLKFDLTVTPDGESLVAKFKFDQKFYTD